LIKLENIVKNPLIKKSGIYYVGDFTNFNYSDGDKVERYILNAIRDTQDISSDSRELEAYIKDWPSRYHLSRQRTLAYRSLDIPSSATILEVGCGCGSITRFLGERAGAVIGLEGSPRRAEITRVRTRDLQSVSVLCASFDEVTFSQKFDIVICNGVLEYASLFVDHKEPHRRMIELLSAIVAPGGSLIIAIENKLGLRYFASGKEEHTNVMFDGLEGYPRAPGGARTFGERELKRILDTAFTSVETLLPLPDYKLPTAIIRADLLDLVNCAELFSTMTRQDFGSQVLPRMHERLVWHELQKNGQLRDFANSFFMIAGNRKTALLEPDWMGDIYSIGRKPEWTIRTQIYAEKEGSVWTVKSNIEPDAPKPPSPPFIHRTDETKWSNGVSIHTAIARTLHWRGKTPIEDRIREPVLAWWAGIKKLSPVDGLLSGAVLDHNWQNTLMNDGGVDFIDSEWIWTEPIEPAWLIYRVVSIFARDEVFYVHRWDRTCRSMSVYNLMKAVAKIVGVELDIGALIRAAEQERDFEAAVIGRKISKLMMVRKIYTPLRVRQWLILFKNRYRKIVGRDWLARLKRFS
jgi:SAM-dependent methyltransferase